MKNKDLIKGAIIGGTAVLLLFLAFQKFATSYGRKEQNDYYLLTNQITKMNKMVVLEQDFSSMQKTNLAYEILGNKVSDNQIITFTKTNAQVSYDLNEMKLEVDSTNKKLIIKELPEPKIRISPSVEIQSINDSFFNRIDENQIKKVTQSAKENAQKTVNQNRLKAEGKKQLLQNLDHIFVLAKALNYQIVDESKSLNLSNL